MIRSVKTLRTDNGLEFFNRVFDEFCGRKGIQRHRTCAYTPQQNGVLLGYPSGFKGYKIWLTEERKCVVSRNVIFQENAVYIDLIQRKENFQEEQNELSYSYIDLDLEAEHDTSSGGDCGKAQRPTAPNSPVALSPHNIDFNDESEMYEEDSPLSYHLVRDRDRREVRAPRRFDDEDYFSKALYTTEGGDSAEPSGYTEDRVDTNWSQWKQAMDE